MAEDEVSSYVDAALTCRAVIAGPVGVTAASTSVSQEGPMSSALVHAGGPGALTAQTSPAHEAVALPPDTHPSARARRVQAIH